MEKKRRDAASAVPSICPNGALTRVRRRFVASVQGVVKEMVQEGGYRGSALAAVPEGEQGMNMARYVVFLADLHQTGARTSIGGRSFDATITNAAGAVQWER